MKETNLSIKVTEHQEETLIREKKDSLKANIVILLEHGPPAHKLFLVVNDSARGIGDDSASKTRDMLSAFLAVLILRKQVSKSQPAPKVPPRHE